MEGSIQEQFDPKKGNLLTSEGLTFPHDPETVLQCGLSNSKILMYVKKSWVSRNVQILQRNYKHSGLTVFGVANSMWVDICLHDRRRDYIHPTLSQRIVGRTVESMLSLPYPIFSSFVAACENALLIWYSDRTCTNNTKNNINYCIYWDLFVMQPRSLSFANWSNQQTVWPTCVLQPVLWHLWCWTSSTNLSHSEILLMFGRDLYRLTTREPITL